MTRWFGLAISLLFLGALQARADSKVSVRWPAPVEVSQGGLTEIHVEGKNLAAVEGRLHTAPIAFYPVRTNSFAAIIGADVDAKPGLSKLVLKATNRAGTSLDRIVPFKVKAKAFRTESFNVPPGFDEVSPETLEEIRREQMAFARAFGFSAPERLWEAPFERPVPQEASASSFGSRRVINGTPRAPHSGTDMAAPMGTEVLAANHGRVVLMGQFFFAGGSIVLDHGAGLFTMYFHLSEFRVEEGALVQRGDVIGLSGSSGRVTGPHLHWGARLGNARIDPLQLLSKISVNSAGTGNSTSVTSQTEK